MFSFKVQYMSHCIQNIFYRQISVHGILSRFLLYKLLNNFLSKSDLCKKISKEKVIY